ncbi:MAG: polysaccharide biosynthesis tyrosine autokinase [Planctomycetes bacterium]|nr:polysaccharide biosynthesis tyrosine autokinase [Planctomycetota bacterium]
MTTVSTPMTERTALPGSAHGVGIESARGPTASDLWSMIRRRLVLIVVLFILFSALAIGGFGAWWVYLPGYTSECLIECISNIPETQLTADQERLRQDEHERFVRTQAMLLTTPGILSEALKVTAVRETSWFKRTSRSRRDPLLVLTDELSVAPVRGTNFIRVAIECRNPKDPRIIVNEVVNEWYHTVKKQTSEAFASEALQDAHRELQDLDRVIAGDRDRLKQIAQRLPPGSIQNPAGNITAQQVRQSGELVAMLDLELSQLEQYRDIYNDPEGVAVTAEDRAMVEQDPQIAELARLLFLLEQQRAADANVYGAGHSVVKQLDAQLEAAEAKLAQLRMERLQERRADMREAVNTAYSNSRYAMFQAREKLARDEAALQDQDRLLFDYLDLDAKVKQDLEYRNELSDYIKGLARVKRQRTAIQVNVAQPPIDPLERSSPNLLLIPASLMFMLMLAVGVGLSLELMDKSVRTPQDITRHLDLAVLGVIPDTADEETTIKHVETAVQDAPRSMVAEGFRRIRTRLQFSGSAERQKVVMVVSPRPNDGKTTVSCNLAMTFAQTGRRVLLVDANLRREGFRRVFDHLKPEGLSNILTGKATLESCVVSTEMPGLEILGSGPMPPNPVELLDSEACKAFLREVRERYDYVILDTAPILVASDSIVLAPAVDGVILVVRANRSSKGLVRRASALLTDVGANIFGAVLNAAQITRGGYFREQFRTYYDYQSDST